MCFEIHLECEYCGKEIREWITKYENSEGCQIPCDNGEFFQLLTVVTKRDQKCHICEFLPGMDKNNIALQLKVTMAPKLSLFSGIQTKDRMRSDFK